MSENSSQRFDTLMSQAEEDLQKLRLGKALEGFQAAGEMRPGNYDANLGIVHTLIRMRRQEEAVAAARECVDLDPNRFEAHTALGILHFLADENQEALRALKQAIELAPTDPQPHLTLSQVYSDLGDQEEAHAELSRAREIISALKDEQEHNRWLAMAWHAETYQRLGEGKDQEAIESAQETIALEAANPYAACLAYSNLGILEARSRHYDLAIDYLEHALDLNPFFYRAGGALGRLLIIRGHPERAAEVLSQTLEQTRGQKGSTRYAYAVALRKSGQREKALDQYRQALGEGIRILDALASRWQLIWLSKWGRYGLVGLALAAFVAWLVFGNPTPQALTLVGLLALIVILQNTVGRRGR